MSADMPANDRPRDLIQRLRFTARGSEYNGPILNEAADAIEAYLQAAPSEPQERRDGSAAFRGLTDDQRSVLRRCFHADGTPKRTYATEEEFEHQSYRDPRAEPYWCEHHRGYHAGKLRDGDPRKNDHPKAASEPNALLSEHRCERFHDDKPEMYAVCSCGVILEPYHRTTALVTAYAEHYAQAVLGARKENDGE